MSRQPNVQHESFVVVKVLLNVFPQEIEKLPDSLFVFCFDRLHMETPLGRSHTKDKSTN